MVRYDVRMKEHHMLSNQEYLFLNEQDVLLTNRSVTKTRIGEKAENCLETLKIILESNETDDKFIQKYFSVETIINVLTMLTVISSFYDLRSDSYKLELARRLVVVGFYFYESRFKEVKFFQPKIQEIMSLLDSLNEIANEYDESDPKFEMFKKRMIHKKPPIDESHSSPFWRAECMCCWNFSQEESEQKVINKLRHERWCTFDKKDPKPFLKIIPPQK